MQPCARHILPALACLLTHFALLADGPSHFIRDTTRNRLLESHGGLPYGWRVVPVPFTEHETVLTKGAEAVQGALAQYLRLRV